MKLEYQGENGTRRIYRSDDGRLTVEISPTEYDRSKNSLMTQWVKHGLMPRFVERALNVSTYLKTEDGEVGECFNPQSRSGSRGWEPVFEWMLEDAPENERRILEEIERRYNEFGGDWQAACAARGPAVIVRFPQEEVERSRGWGEELLVLVSDEVHARVKSGESEGEVFDGVLYNDSVYRPELRNGVPVHFETRGNRPPVAMMPEPMEHDSLSAIACKPEIKEDGTIVLPADWDDDE